MKFSATLLMLLAMACNSSVAQQPTPERNNNRQIIEPFRLLKEKSKISREATRMLHGKLQKFSLLSLAGNYESLQKQASNSDHFILQLPGEPKIRLQKHQLATPGFFVKTSDGQTFHNIKAVGNNFIGKIENEQRSVAAISFNRTGMKGFISNEQGNKIIEPIQFGTNGLHILYNDRDISDQKDFTCHAVEEGNFKENTTGQFVAKPTGSCKTVKMYIECSYAMYQAHNSNVNDVIDFVFSMFNASSALFKNDSINIQISEMFIWNQPDIYAALIDAPSLAYALQNKLRLEHENGQRLDADIAHLITPLNFSGGAATNIGIINNCGRSNGTYSTAASSLINSFFPLPNYSKTIYIFTHETGHLLGSWHTQSCNWPGGPIDNCSAPEDGSCSPGPAPVNGGTIMSYCNNTPYGVNFLNGFGPLPAARMRNEIENSTCISACADTACGNVKLQGLQTMINPTSIKLKWIAEAPKYRIGLKSNTTQQWQYYEILNTDSFELAKTSCESLYEYCISPFCTSLNKYGTAYTSYLGDTLAIRLKLNQVNVVAICAGDSLALVVDPDSNFTYQWYTNGLLQPQFTTRLIYAKQTGNYNVVAIKNGCSYHSDTVSLLRQLQKPRFTPNINGLKVVFTGSYGCSKTIDWDFGDAAHASVNPATHVYQQRGIYNVVLKVWDADGNLEQFQKAVNLSDEFIDSLNSFTQYGFPVSMNYVPFACRDVALFTKDSMNKNTPAIILPGPSLRYAQNTGNAFIEPPKTGTLEFKLYPQNGLVKLRAVNGVMQISDTGYVLNISFGVQNEKNTFFLFFSKWGGMQVAVDSVVLGNIANGVAGPLKLNEWNNIGISYGDEGIHIMLNGQLFASDPHIVDSAHAAQLGRFNFGSYLGRIGYGATPLYFKGFEGAIDLIRFSHKQKDFSFSSSAAWQGTDTVVIGKQVCNGDSYLGYTASGTYYKSAVTAAGCDSITQVNLLVHDAIIVKDSLIHPVDTAKGSILVQNISAVVEPLKYQWNTGDTTRDLHGIVAGKYTLRVIDALGCEKTISYILYQLSSKKDYIVVFPNPVVQNGILTLRTGTASNKKYECIIYDVLGRKYLEQTININAGVTETVIKQKLIGGAYILFLKNGNEKSSLRFIVK